MCFHRDKYLRGDIDPKSIGASYANAGRTIKNKDRLYKAFLLKKSAGEIYYYPVSRKEFVKSSRTILMIAQADSETHEIFSIGLNFYLPKKERKIVAFSKWTDSDWVEFIVKKSEREYLLEKRDELRKAMRKNNGVKLNSELKNMTKQKLAEIENELRKNNEETQSFYGKIVSREIEQIVFTKDNAA